MSGFGDRLSQRQKGFKKAVDAEDARRKREDAAVQLRKQMKDEALQKKRMVNEAVPGMPGAIPTQDFSIPTEANGQRTHSRDAEDVTEDVDHPWARPHSATFGQDQIPGLCQMLASQDPQAQFSATQQFRKLLSIEQNPPIQAVIASGVVSQFVLFLKEVNRPDLQFEAAWVLTNIASGTAEQTRCVVEHGALPIFVELLRSPKDNVREQAVWALGNIAGDSPNFRDLVLQSGGLMPIMQVLHDTENRSMQRNATWALSNLCRGKPPPQFEWVHPALNALSKLIHSSDADVLTDSCWALSYFSDGESPRITAVIQAGICPRLVELLLHNLSTVQTPALRAIGNIVTGDDSQTQAMLQCGVLPHLLKLLSHTKKAIRKESCWTISNITAGNRTQIQCVLNENLIPPIINLLATADFDIKKEAAWAISNVTSGGSPQQVEYVVQQGCVKPMVDLLTVSDAKIIGIALECIENVLKTGKQKQTELGLAENPFAMFVEHADGLQKIEALQEDPNEDVYRKAVGLLENYFQIEEGDDIDCVDDAAPQFQFGAPLPAGGFNFGMAGPLYSQPCF